MSEQHNPKARILVDIDATLYDANSLFIRLFREIHGIDLAAISDWDFYQQHMSAEEFGRFIKHHFHAEHEVKRAAPFRGAVEALRDWADAGAEIHVVSDRPTSARRATRHWLEEIGVPFERLVARTPIDKVAYVRRQRIDLVIDDKPATLAGCATLGVPSATLAYPYNRDVLAAHPQIIHARHWPSLRRKVDAHLVAHHGLDLTPAEAGQEPKAPWTRG